MIIEVEHVVTGDGCAYFGFDGLGEAFFAEFFARVLSAKEGFISFACST